MKRTLVLLMSLAILAGSFGTAEAGKPRRVERTVQGSYGAYPTPVTGCNSALGPWACLIVQTRRTEAFFSAGIADTHGQPVLVNVWTGQTHVAAFCGKTRGPIRIPPGAELRFEVGQGRAPWTDIPCPEHIVKTTGKITVTLSNQR